MMEETRQAQVPIGNEELIPAAQAYEFLAGLTPSFKREPTDRFLYQMLARIYEWLDSFTGITSRVFLDTQEAVLSSYRAIIADLYERGHIERVSLEYRHDNGAPGFWGLDLLPNVDPGTTDGNPVVKWIGHAVGQDLENVYSRAIGEFFERYCLLFYKQKDLVRSSLSALRKAGKKVLPLEHLAGFSTDQKKRKQQVRWDETSIFPFTQMTRYSTGEKVLAPAQLIFWNYVPIEGESFLGEGNTNGAGGMFTKEGALLSGLYELIQRDAFLIFWLNKLAPPRIDPDTVPNEQFQDLLAQSRRYGFNVHVLDTTLDTGIPSSAVVLEDPTGKSSRFCVGGGCELDAGKAIAKSLEEAWGVHYWTGMLPPYSLAKDYQPFAKGIGQDERLALWANPEMADAFAFFLAGNERPFSELLRMPEFSSNKEELRWAVERVERLGKGYEVYYYLASHQLLSHYSYYSAQVVVLPFIPLYLFERNAPLGAQRLREIPGKFGYRAARELNPFPHPFP